MVTTLSVALAKAKLHNKADNLSDAKKSKCRADFQDEIIDPYRPSDSGEQRREACPGPKVLVYGLQWHRSSTTVAPRNVVVAT